MLWQLRRYSSTRLFIEKYRRSKPLQNSNTEFKNVNKGIIGFLYNHLWPSISYIWFQSYENKSWKIDSIKEKKIYNKIKNRLRWCRNVYCKQNCVKYFEKICSRYIFCSPDRPGCWIHMNIIGFGINWDDVGWRW